MKIGISLAGVSYSTSGKRRDFRKTYQNFFDTFYNPLAESHTVSVYTTTYPHKLQEEFLADYKPKKHQFIPFEGSHPRSTLVHGLCLAEEEDIDILICTRFDIKFNLKVTEMDIKWDKFNFFFKEKDVWEDHKFVTDNLFIFPKPYLYELAESVQELCDENLYQGHTFMHHIYRYVEKRVGSENIHFICGDELALSHNNRFYDLVRTEQTHK